MTLFLSSDNLLTGYEQLSYQQFSQNFSICASLAKDWFMLFEKFCQEDLATWFFKQKIDSCERKSLFTF